MNKRLNGLHIIYAKSSSEIMTADLIIKANERDQFRDFNFNGRTVVHRRNIRKSMHETTIYEEANS
jgi:hypothetical protein